MIKSTIGAIAAVLAFSLPSVAAPWHYMGITDEGEKLVLNGSSIKHYAGDFYRFQYEIGGRKRNAALDSGSCASDSGMWLVFTNEGVQDAWATSPASWKMLQNVCIAINMQK